MEELLAARVDVPDSLKQALALQDMLGVLLPLQLGPELGLVLVASPFEVLPVAWLWRVVPLLAEIGGDGVGYADMLGALLTPSKRFRGA